jgi:hypothetical protein
MFDTMDDAGVVDVITDAARARNAMCARELAAIGELYARRAPAADADRVNWAIDGHENVVAEVAAALGVSRGRAAGRLRYAIALRERLPRVAEVFARGAIDFRLMAVVVYRTELVEDPELIAKLDAAVARHAQSWMRLSALKAIERIDMWVARFDPAGLRVPSNRSEDRYVVSLCRQIPGSPDSMRSYTPPTGPRWTARLTRWPRRCVGTTLGPKARGAPMPWVRWLPGWMVCVASAVHRIVQRHNGGRALTS